MNVVRGYFERIEAKRKSVIAVLKGRKVDKRYLLFGGPGPEPTRKPSVPASERGDFFVHRPLGDWAEETLRMTLQSAFPEWQIAKYGNADVTQFHAPDFKERYLNSLLQTRLYGKRPDLLVFPKDLPIASGLHEQEHAQIKGLVGQAVAAIEVRSSKLDALTFMAARKSQREAGKKVDRLTPSFTVKIEDLIIVYRWIEHYRVPQSYCQVFFDSIFALNFLDIFEIIGSGEGFTIQAPERSQQKPTILIPITRGIQIAHSVESPKISARHQVSKLGRHEAFLVPEDGRFKLDGEGVRRLLLAGKTL